MSDGRIVHVRTERSDVFASWYVILTDNNEPVALRLFDSRVVYPDGYKTQHHVFDVPLSIIRSVGILGGVHDDAQG
jgi:hypothetical protein